MKLRATRSIWGCLFLYHVITDIVHCDTVEERLSTWATRHGLPSDDITTLPTFDTSSASSNLSTGLDGLFTEQLAETFLTKFLDTKRIEDFVKSIPAGQEPLELFATIPKSTLPLTKGWKVMPGEQEEILVGLRNLSKINSIIVFGILSSITHPLKSHEIYKKNKAVTYSLEIMPGHEATVLYPFCLQGPFEERRVGLEVSIHFMDKGSKLFGKISSCPIPIEISAVTSYWLDAQLIVILAVMAAFLAFFLWIIYQAYLKGRRIKRKYSE